MTPSGTLSQQLAIAIVAASALILATSTATAERAGRGELVNRPVSPFPAGLMNAEGELPVATKAVE